jgi:hypothetical protein
MSVRQTCAYALSVPDASSGSQTPLRPRTATRTPTNCVTPVWRRNAFPNSMAFSAPPSPTSRPPGHRFVHPLEPPSRLPRSLSSDVRTHAPADRQVVGSVVAHPRTAPCPALVATRLKDQTVGDAPVMTDPVMTSATDAHVPSASGSICRHADRQTDSPATLHPPHAIRWMTTAEETHVGEQQPPPDRRTPCLQRRAVPSASARIDPGSDIHRFRATPQR